VCTRIWVCTTKNGLKENSKHTSRNKLSLFWAQNKDLGVASQTLLTKVKLRQQCARLTKTLLLKFDVNEVNKFLHKTWSSLPQPGICMYQCMVLYKPCFHSNNKFLDHLDRVSCPGQIMYVQIRLSKWSYGNVSGGGRNWISKQTYTAIYMYLSGCFQLYFSVPWKVIFMHHPPKCRIKRLKRSDEYFKLTDCKLTKAVLWGIDIIHVFFIKEAVPID